jgi:Ca2+/H+ antiporter
VTHHRHRPRRWHEIERELREQEQRDRDERRKFWHNAILVKTTVMVTFVAYMLVPPDFKDWVALSGNLLWLWKT